MLKIEIREAVESDVPVLLGFIRELAEYEKLSDDVVADERTVRATLFGPRPVAEAMVASFDSRDVGFALFFHNYSTFLGRAGLYLEDLYVQPAARGAGVGQALFGRLVELALERDCHRMEWSVLNWNSPAIRFYETLGAEPLDQWTVYRLTRTALEKLSGKRGCSGRIPANRTSGNQ
ncbi:MAG: GNAT family N-acetyltransferase [Pseudomonadota bacterium]|nr:GNAT family N-acetyltransferase [Pseudomonadota bacterium]